MYASLELQPIYFVPEASVPYKGRLLIVDDDDFFLRTMNKACSKEGYQVVTWNPNNRGWDLPDEQNFDAIIMDFQLGAIKGTQLAAMIRGTPVMLVSTSKPNEGFWPSSISRFETKYRGVPHLVRAVKKMRQQWVGGLL